MTLNGNGGWKNWILTILFGALVTLTLFGTVQIQSKADKEEVRCVEQRLILRDQELKSELIERSKINYSLIEALSNKMDENNRILIELNSKKR